MTVTTSIRSAIDVANNALVRLGYAVRVGSLYDGSEASQKIIQVYGQARDELLEAFDYDFAESIVLLSLLKSAPVGGYFPPNLWNPASMPPRGFMFEYAYPGDAIKIRAIQDQPLYVVNMDPQQNNFTEYNDGVANPPSVPSPPGRVVVTNVPNAICVYTRRVTDPTEWSAKFADSLAARLAVLLGPALMKLDPTKLIVGEMAEDQALNTAENR